MTLSNGSIYMHFIVSFYIMKRLRAGFNLGYGAMQMIVLLLLLLLLLYLATRSNIILQLHQRVPISR